MFESEPKPTPGPSSAANLDARSIGPRPLGPAGRPVDPAVAALPAPTVETVTQVFGHLTEPSDQPKPVFKPDGTTTHPDGTETQGPPTAREVAPAAAAAPAAPAPAAPETETGAGRGIPGADGTVDARPVANLPATEERARAAAAQMRKEEQENYVGLLTGAKNQAQRVMMERAVAAGRSMEEVQALATRMATMDDKAIMANFTGAGIFQGFKNSCVPASYQIANAEMDPVFAMELRDDPEAAIEKQRGALIEGGGSPIQREDVANNREVPRRVQAAVNENPGVRDSMMHTPEVDGSGIGMEATNMPGSRLHNRLESSAGTQMEVLTQAGANFKTPGAGEFPADAPPNAHIQSSLDQGVPVIFGADKHERVIVGQTVGPDGRPSYLVQDPSDGATGPVAIDDMDGERYNPMHIVTPKPAARGAAGEAPQPAVDIPTAASFAPKPAAPGEAGPAETPGAEPWQQRLGRTMLG